MLELQLYIEGNKIETFKDESITLNQSIQDIRDISKVFTEFSRTFNVPASRNNNKVFKHFYNFNIIGFDARKKREAILTLNYKPFKKGKIKLEGVTLKNNEPETYKLTFFGNTVDIKDVLGEDKLSNLTNLKLLNFDYTDTNVEAFFTNGKDVDFFGETINDALLIPLITTSNRVVYDTAAVNTETVKNINNIVGDVGLPLSDLKPAIRLYCIIRAIEVQYEEITFNREFFATTNSTFFDLYLWLHNKEGKLFIDQDAQFPVGDFLPLKAGSTSISGFKAASFKNEYDEDKAERELNFDIIPSGSAAYSFIIKKDGELFQEFDNLTGNVEKKKIELPVGNYTFYIESLVASTYTVEITIKHKPTSIVQFNKKVSYSGTATVTSSREVNIPSIVPDMKIIDFLTGLFKLFNLTAFKNDDGIIEVKDLNTFYNSSSKIHDITKFIDKTETSVDAILPFKEISFSYEGLDSFIANNHYELDSKGWGSLNYRDGDKFDGDTYEVKAPFEHFKYERLFVTTNGVIQTSTNSAGNDENNNTSIIYGYSVDKNQQPYLGKPLLFYPAAVTSTVRVIKLDEATKTNISNPYMPFNHLGGFVFNNLQTLNFGAEISEYHREPNNTSIFKTFYEDYVKDMMDPRKRITSFKAYLPMKILHNLSLADKFQVYDNIYRINRITTDFTTNKSTVEVTNIFPEFTYNTLLSIAIQGILADSTLITADDINITVDGNSQTDGFDIPDITTPVPSEIPSNTPKPKLDEEILRVTAPKIAVRISSSNTNTEVFLKYAITELGKLVNTPQVEEYGFFYSTDSSNLTSTDIETLKGTANVTNIPFFTDYQNKFTIPDNISYKIENLLDPSIIYYKFYARTNINPLFPLGDTLSEIEESKTVSSAVPIGNLAIQISSFANDVGNPNVSCGVQFNTGITAIWFFEHTGGAREIQVGDFFRTTGRMDFSGSDSWGFATYGGGQNSLVGFSGLYTIPSFINFLDFQVLNDQLKVTSAFRINRHTAQVTKITTCP